MTCISSRSGSIAVPIHAVSIRGPLSPWQMLAEALALHVGRALTVGEVGLGAGEYARLMAEERIYRMRGYDGPHARATLARGTPLGFALVPAAVTP